MKNNFFKISLSALFLFVGLNACKDDLQISDPNRLSSEGFYENEAQAIAAVDAIYNALIIDGMYQRITPIYNDGRGDELSSRSPWTFMTGFSSFTVPATEGALEIFWAGHYIMVSRANQVLENVPNIEGMDADLKERLLGQAYFLRGLAYFNLTNVQDNVPLILETPKGSEAFYPSNADVTQEKVYAQVKSDLENAISRLPLNYNALTNSPDAGQEGRATKGAAQSLLGTVLLYEGNHAAAKTQFEAVVNSNQYTLAPNYADLYSQDPAVERANTERIFWAEFTTSANSDFNWGGDPTVNWRQFIALTPTYSQGDFFDFYPTPFLYNEMREEKTVDNKLDPRYHATILSYEPTEGYTTAYNQDWLTRYGPGSEGNYYIKKYTNAVGGTDAFTAGFNYHIIRYADVLLMYAECLANTGDMANAAKYVQQVRDRANLPNRESEFAGYSLDQFMAQMEHERVMELPIEGKRWYDIKRWGYLKDASKLEELKAHDFEFNTYSDGREFIPIPQSELDRNPNLVGNSAN
ncbi:MAG: RagB/SusD family nutrient uptake outer membrane protein [Saprospiraceae bacterium]|nr:RagB/SusD family nutrient uptake outer membrane protein [Saprospiraceae bacterium]